jgi:hypothetical protein
MQHSALRRYDDVGWVFRDAKLVFCLWRLIAVNLYRDEIGFDRGRNVGPAEHIPIHLAARRAPVSPEVDQHEPIGLPSQTLGRW